VKAASLACQAWRDAVLPLLISGSLRVALADVTHGGPEALRTRGQWRSCWLDLDKLLARAHSALRLDLTLGDLRWPTPQQVAAAVAAVQRHGAVRQLRLRLLEQVEELDAKRCAAYRHTVAALCSGVALGAPHVTSLELTAGHLPRPHLRDVTACLAQLPGLRHLTFTGAELSRRAVRQLAGAPQLAASLTSLHLCLGDKTFRRLPELGALLQQLGQLGRLQALRLSTCIKDSGVVALPAWPELRRLELECGPDARYNLQLSAEHCERLEELAAAHWHAAVGAVAMPRLRRLATAAGSPCQPAAEEDGPLLLGVLPPPRQQLQLQQLRFPGLQRLSFSSGQQEGVGWADTLPGAAQRPVLLQALELAALAPALQELELGQLEAVCQEAQEAEAGLLALLESCPELLRLQLPLCRRLQEAGAAPELTSSSPDFSWQLLGLVAQQGRLQALALHHTLPPEQHHLLRSLASLRRLELRNNRAALLAHLPPQLTALTFTAPLEAGPDGAGGSAAQQPGTVDGAAAAPKLRSLCTDVPALVLAALPLAQLEGLTSLTATGEPGARLQPLGPGGEARVGQLSELQELHARPWPGLAQQLPRLQQLRSLKLALLQAREVEVMECEVSHLGDLAQLRELVMGSCYQVSWPRRRQLVQRAARALPRCLVRGQCLVRREY
jgi:hypothetical protein